MITVHCNALLKCGPLGVSEARDWKRGITYQSAFFQKVLARLIRKNIPNMPLWGIERASFQELFCEIPRSGNFLSLQNVNFEIRRCLELNFLRFFRTKNYTKMHEKSMILGEKHQISRLAYLGWVELVLDRSKTVRDVFVGKI